MPRAEAAGAPEAGARRPVRVLVVDDSALVREGMAAVLSRDGDMEVAVAADPLIAMAKMKSTRPDVIVLDLEMPRMDGLTFLRKIMSEDPLPVVVCSGFVTRGSDRALRALGEGAVDIVVKPRLGLREFFHEEALGLLDSVRAAAQARVAPLPPVRGDGSRGELAARPPKPPAAAGAASGPIVAVGASTGGPEGLRVLLEAMPADAPAMLIVQHMPAGYTHAFAAHLDRRCRLAVKEAEEGDRVAPGRVLVAPGNRHMLVQGRLPHCVVSVRDGPLVSRHRPSVDVLFRSVAGAAAGAAVGVLLTGMGDDGAQGLLEMRRAGAATIAEDESTCVVFGMPKQAIARGAAEQVLPLAQIPAAILRRVRERSVRRA